MKSILGLMFLGMAVVMMAGCGGAEEEADGTPETTSLNVNAEVTTVGLESASCKGCSGDECKGEECGEKCGECPAAGEKCAESSASCDKCDGKCESTCKDCKDEKTEGDAKVSSEKEVATK